MKVLLLHLKYIPLVWYDGAVSVSVSVSPKSTKYNIKMICIVTDCS